MKFWKRNIPDPIKGLTLDRLNHQLDAYNHGLIAEFAITAEAMEQRDDILRNVILKRKKAVARHGYAILTCSDSPEARRHKAALEFFYKNLRCTHVLKQDLDGGLNLLIGQMMDALAKGWAVHEITWRPRFTCSSSEANKSIGPCGFTADLRFVPLWFFENTTGKLRLLPEPYSLEGQPLKPREWLVTTGEALMIACARAFLFKHFPLQAWLDYCEKYGTPGLRGVTAAARDTPEWLAMEHTLDQFMQDLAIVTTNTENIEVIDLKGRGESPFHLLVERMDRTMAALWRGADLSTISRDRGYGASLQEQESKVLEVDDANMISETLNKTLDRWVIEYLFGQGTEPLAYIKILVSPRECTPHDLAIDEFLVRHGAKLSISKTLEHYGRAPARPSEPFLAPAQSSSDIPQENAAPGSRCFSERFLSNESFMKTETQNETNQTSETNISNQFAVEQSTLLQLSPFGEFPHSKGIQLVDPDAAQVILKNFKSFFSRLGRRFAGVPIYVGHPDLPGYENIYCDHKAYGWVMELVLQPEGLFGVPKWSKVGKELIENAHYKFLSPFWEASEVGMRNGRKLYRPHTLISVGLTNQPNLPMFPLSNEKGTGTPARRRFFGLPMGLDRAQPDDLVDVVGPCGSHSKCAESSPQLTHTTSSASASKTHEPANNLMNNKEQDKTNQPNNELYPGIPSRDDFPQGTKSKPDLGVLLAQLQQTVHAMGKRVDDLNARFLSVVVDNAILDGRIAPSDRERWRAELDEDFPAKSLQLVNTLRTMKVENRTDDFASLGASGGLSGAQGKRIQKILKEKMATGMTYHEAWVEFKEENPAIMAAMGQPYRTSTSPINSGTL